MATMLERMKKSEETCQIEIIANDIANETCNRIFGQMWKEYPQDENMRGIFERVRDSIMGLELSWGTSIALDLKANHNGEIKLEHGRKLFNEWPPIFALCVDDVYGTYVRFTEKGGKNNDEFAYCDEWFTREELETIERLFYSTKRIEKMPYINAIADALRNKADFTFDLNTTMILPLYGEDIEHVLLGIYLHPDTKEVCLRTRIYQETESRSDYLLDFDIADVKRIFDIFVNQFYEPIPSDQITDQEFMEALDRLNQVSN